MSRPALVDIKGTSQKRVTWVAELQFNGEDLSISPQAVLELQKVLPASWKEYHFGIGPVCVPGFMLIIIHVDNPKQAISVQGVVEGLLNLAKLQCSFKVLPFSRFSEFLMGFSAARAEESKARNLYMLEDMAEQNADKDEDEADEQDQGGEEVRPSKRARLASSSSAPASNQDFIWLNGQPASLCLYVDYVIPENHKVN